MADYAIASPPRSVLSDDASSNKDTILLNNIKSYGTEKKCYGPPHGRKTFAFWTLVGLLFFLAVGNLVLTMTILGVLRLGRGMQSIELLPRNRAVKLFGDVDLDRVYKQDGKIDGFEGENVEVVAEEGTVLINLYSRLNRISNKLKIDINETCFNGFNSFMVRNKQKRSVFNMDEPLFENLKRANDLKSKTLETNAIRSPLNDNLKIEGDRVQLNGAEGTKIEAREILWTADQDIYLKSSNGSIILSAKEGAYIDVRRIPVARLDRKTYITAQFKICVCMPQGKLFRVPVVNANDPVYCHHVNMSAQYNPCISI